MPDIQVRAEMGHEKVNPGMMWIRQRGAIFVAKKMHNFSGGCRGCLRFVVAGNQCARVMDDVIRMASG